MDIIDPGYSFPREDHCPQSMYDAQMDYFIDCIREKRRPVPGAAEGLTNMKIVQAAYESARAARVVEIR